MAVTTSEVFTIMHNAYQRYFTGLEVINCCGVLMPYPTQLSPAIPILRKSMQFFLAVYTPVTYEKVFGTLLDNMVIGFS